MPYLARPLVAFLATELVLTLTNGMRQMVERNSTAARESATRVASISFSDGLEPRLTTDARHTGFARRYAKSLLRKHLRKVFKSMRMADHRTDRYSPPLPDESFLRRECRRCCSVTESTGGP